MGFLDKVKASAESAVKQGQDKLDEVQAKKRAEGLLQSLGAWQYTVATGRDDGRDATELARVSAALQAHEAEHGALPLPPPTAAARSRARARRPWRPTSAPAPGRHPRTGRRRAACPASALHPPRPGRPLA